MKLHPGDVHGFPGEEEIKAELPDGPVSDLGLLYKRGKVTAAMHVIDFKKTARSFNLKAHTNIFYVAHGSVKVSIYPGEHTYELEADDALAIHPPHAKDPAQETIALIEPNEKSQLIGLEIHEPK
jgi:environmental stress-induced protein Ves